MKRNILAIDIGGSKILTAAAVVSDESGKMQCALSGIVKEPLFKESSQVDILAAIDRLIQKTFLETGLGWNEICCIGATIPGLADRNRRYWIYAPFSGIRDFPIGSILKEKYGKKVFAENDVNACAWAEKIFGVCSNVDDFLWVTVSNGIGGGLVLRGDVYSGAFGGAAEFGHLCVVENGHLCGCGNHGCLEAEAAGPGIARRFIELMAKNPNQQKEFGLDKPTAETIAQAARNNNPFAQQIYEQTGYYLGRAAAWAANLINPAKIVIGGGVAGAFDLFFPQMEETFKEQSFRSVNNKLIFEKTGLGYEAGLFAAASLTCVPE